MSRAEHLYITAEWRGPEIPLCQHMIEIRVTRSAAVKCAECNRRAQRLPPWDAARYLNTERLLNSYIRRESGMVLMLWYGEPEPEMVWDQKTRRRLK